MKKNFNIYVGDGNSHFDGSADAFPKMETDDAPQRYIASQGLANAVNVSIMLGKPLLVTGEPGTGKTQLAHGIAHELNLGEPLVFHTKTTSIAKDLLYTYDSLARFEDIQLKQAKNIDDYIAYGPLGQAIMDSHTNRRLVLVDEIDKAPRDFPNDLLYEIEKYSFTVKELEGKPEMQAHESRKPIVVLTSNSEKNLPDAFLRRCVFFHLEFPKPDQLLEIVKTKLPFSVYSQPELSEIVKHFMIVRDISKRKKPATAELISWVQVLEAMGLDSANIARIDQLKPEQKEILLLSYSVLAKTRDDREAVMQNLG